MRHVSGVVSTVVCVFFFKQKTAYEMRISDWSSDVCPSDLDDRRILAAEFERHVANPDGGLLHDRLACPGLSRKGYGVHILVGGQIFPEIGRASCRERVCQYV